MRKSPFWWILISFMVLLDIYFFQSLEFLSRPAPGNTRTLVYIVYWALSVSFIVVFLLLPYLHFKKQARFIRTVLFTLIAGLFFAKLVASLFFFADDIRRLIVWAAGSFQGTGAISRSSFLSWAGIIAGGGLFLALIIGFGSKYRYEIKRLKLVFDNLPPAFKGLKLVHISDIHSGSFTDKKAVLEGVNKILEEKPDLILFTGDLVNNMAAEMNDYMDVFEQLRAPLGVYSTLGNHDYGDYMQWNSPEEKSANLERLKEIHAELGWRLLMNEHIVLEKGADRIAVIGI